MHHASKVARLSHKVQNIYKQLGSQRTLENDAAISEKELWALVEVNLGEKYNREKISRVARLQRELHEKQEQLVSQLNREAITAEKYIERLRTVLTETALACEKILGPDDFVKLFGVPANHAADLVNSSR
jgi:hypothetical protein